MRGRRGCRCLVLRSTAGGQPGASNPQEWECGLNRSRREPGGVVAGQSRPVCLWAGNPEGNNDERADGRSNPSAWRPALSLRAPPVLWRGGNVVTSDLLGRGGRLWRRNDDARQACACWASRLFLGKRRAALHYWSWATWKQVWPTTTANPRRLTHVAVKLAERRLSGWQPAGTVEHGRGGR